MALKLHSYQGVEFEVHTFFEKTGLYTSAACPLCPYKVASPAIDDSEATSVEMTSSQLKAHLVDAHTAQLAQ